MSSVYPRFLILFLLLFTFGYSKAQCGLDIFVANDQSGSVDATENSQGREFITILMENVQPWGTGAGESRMAIAQWTAEGYGGWVQYNFPVAGVNYTTHLSDVVHHQNSPRTLTGEDDFYMGLLETYQAVNQNPVPGRVANKVIIMMTDAWCGAIRNNIGDLATEIKNSGIHVMVLAIGMAASCDLLYDDNVASPGGYFAANSYAELYDEAVAYVENIIQNACQDPPPPKFDLTIALNDYTASNCDSVGIGTYKVSYTVTNVGQANFNDNLTISFYNDDPKLPTAQLVAVQSLGTRNIPIGTTYNGSFTSPVLRTSQNLFAVVNFNGNTAGVNPPMPPNILDYLNVSGERTGRNNFGGPFYRRNDISCRPGAIINVTVNRAEVGCDGVVNYDAQICNTGDASTNITSITPFADSGLVLKSAANVDVEHTVQRIWATYFGGSAFDDASLVAVDKAGDIFMAGSVDSDSHISTPGSHQPNHAGLQDGYLAKFSGDGTLLWATYYGGERYDSPKGLGVDANGNIYLAGETNSRTSIATPGAHKEEPDTSIFYSNGFLVKFNSAGVRQWGTYYGGEWYDEIRKLAIDEQGNIYIAGITNSPSGIATPGAHQDTLYGARQDTLFGTLSDGFVAKFDPGGQRQWGTYYGGESYDGLTAISINQNDLYLAGNTASSNNIASTGAHQTESDTLGFFGAQDGFLAKFNLDGQRDWATYYGGNGLDDVFGLATDRNSNVFIAGNTNSWNNIVTPGAFQDSIYFFSSSFLVKFNSSGTRQWGTYYGSQFGFFSETYGGGIATDKFGNVYLGGTSMYSDYLVTPRAHQEYPADGIDEGFLVKFKGNGEREWGTLYAGPSVDHVYGLAVDTSGNIYMVGETESTDSISTPESHQFIYNDGIDGFLVKFSEVEVGIILRPEECIPLQYIYDAFGVEPGTYDLSLGIIAERIGQDKFPLILPDSNFIIQTNLIDGFDGSGHLTDNIIIPENIPACPSGDQVSVEVDIPELMVCGNVGTFVQATVSIINNSGFTITNTLLQLNLSGAGSEFAGEPYELTNNLSIPIPDVLDPSYPNIPFALSGKSGTQFLPIYQFAPGLTTFKIDLRIGTTTANLAVKIDSIPIQVNQSGGSNVASDSQGVAVFPVPGISGFSCPGSIAASNTINITGISTSNATLLNWSSTTVDSIQGTGTVANPALLYLPTGSDITNGYVAISLTVRNDSDCEAVQSCHVRITNVSYDYGDAPITYDLNADSIPLAGSSTILTGMNLGNIEPTSENVADNSATATADGAEEDGLINLTCGAIQPVARADYELTVKATNTTPFDGYLSAFIDWNTDGDYLDDSEKVVKIIRIPALSGTQNHSLDFVVSSDLNVSVSSYFVRLRLSTDSNAVKKSYEASPQGEVEDHLMPVYKPFTAQNITICRGQSITVGGNTYTVAGNYTDTLNNAFGCDSVVSTALNVIEFFSSGQNVFICEGEGFSVGTNTYFQTGTYLDTLLTASGCDSIVTTVLTVLQDTSWISAGICPGQSYQVGNQVFSEAGLYTVELASALGCDSIVILDLSSSPPIFTELQESICEGGSITVGNETFTDPGQYTVALTTGGGCDSTVKLSLSVFAIPDVNASASPDTAGEQEEILLAATPDEAVYSYSWSPVELVSDPQIAKPVATISGDTWFYVVVTDENGCSNIDSVLVHFRAPEGCESLNMFTPSAFTPNGDGQNDVFRVRSSVPFENMKLVVFNRWGESVFESSSQDAGWDGKLSGQDAPADSYGYFFEGDCGIETIRKQGTVVLIR